MVSRNVLAVGLLATLMGIAGCGGGSGTVEKVHTVPVSGTVTYQGKPVADAAVAFVPTAVDDKNARGAFGRTDQSGFYNLMTVQPGDGAVPGSYKVTVSKAAVEAPKSEALTGDAEYVDPETAKQQAPAAIPLVPAKYTSAGSTDLTATVADGAALKLDFELKD